MSNEKILADVMHNMYSLVVTRFDQIEKFLEQMDERMERIESKLDEFITKKSKEMEILEVSNRMQERIVFQLMKKEDSPLYDENDVVSYRR